jgi:hypothetical protein
MTKEEALEIKKITDQCISTIPSQYTSYIYEMFVRHIEPQRRGQASPCTCSGKVWTTFLFRLKDMITDTLRESE